MPKKPATSTIRAALLDEMGVYQGIVEVLPDDVTSLHLPDIAECDLPPGKYRWDFEKQAFHPLPKVGIDKVLKEPNTLKAIALGFASLRNAGIILPPETAQWLDWYATTVDAN